MGKKRVQENNGQLGVRGGTHPGKMQGGNERAELRCSRTIGPSRGQEVKEKRNEKICIRYSKYRKSSINEVR